MKRRSFGLLAGSSLLALRSGYVHAQAAQSAAALNTTLTPMGAQREGNADGSIPAWTGGYTQVPSGWQPGDSMPDFFADEQPVVVVDASNMADYADRLSDGIMNMMKKYGFSIKVYSTHRTASAPQDVYDNIAANVSRSALSPGGGRLGFKGGYGGVPFPIPNTSDPLVAGAQIVWNINSRWRGYAVQSRVASIAVNDGQPIISGIAQTCMDFPYYKQGGSPQSFDGIQARYQGTTTAPADVIGTEVVLWFKTDPYQDPNVAWELLTGQSRVRKAPELQFDTPNSFDDGISNYDESFGGFTGSLEKYDWKYISKKEMYIPYNNNGQCLASYQEAHLPHFINPDVIRWELHRVWVVEATLHPGERNVMARRRFYIDEDTWQLNISDEYDANGDLFHMTHSFCFLRPELPGLVNPLCTAIYDFQTDDYATLQCWWDEKNNPSVKFVDSIPDSQFRAETMAAAGQF